MLGATKSYLVDEALPRLGAILFGSEVFVSIGIGVCAALWGEKFFPTGMKIGELCGTFLSYTAIAMGFCLAGLTIALTLPDREFAKKLATTKAKEKGADAYSDLLFVFSWTAVAHWISLVVLIAVFMRYGSQKDLFPEVITESPNHDRRSYDDERLRVLSVSHHPDHTVSSGASVYRDADEIGLKA